MRNPDFEKWWEEQGASLERSEWSAYNIAHGAWDSAVQWERNRVVAQEQAIKVRDDALKGKE